MRPRASASTRSIIHVDDDPDTDRRRDVHTHKPLPPRLSAHGILALAAPPPSLPSISSSCDRDMVGWGRRSGGRRLVDWASRHDSLLWHCYALCSTTSLRYRRGILSPTAIPNQLLPLGALTRQSLQAMRASEIHNDARKCVEVPTIACSAPGGHPFSVVITLASPSGRPAWARAWAQRLAVRGQSPALVVRTGGKVHRL